MELEDRVTCDFSECEQELPGGADAQLSELMREGSEWALVGGMVFCPEHARMRPWLS